MGSLRYVLRWAPGVEVLVAGLDAFGLGIKQRLKAGLSQVGQQGHAFAVANHPWQNRTGAAEAQLGWQVDDHGDAVELTFYQGAYYGVYLEFRWAGKWGVLPATLTSSYGPAMTAARQAVTL